MRASIFLFLLALSSPALADAIGPPTPIECPPGSSAQTNHCGTVCVVDPCASDAECGAGQACTAHSFCTEDVPCGGWGGVYTIVRSACDTGTCAQGTCQSSINSCAPGTPTMRDAGTEPRVVTYGCGCRAAPRSSALPALLVALLALAVIRRRAARSRERLERA